MTVRAAMTGTPARAADPVPLARDRGPLGSLARLIEKPESPAPGSTCDMCGRVLEAGHGPTPSAPDALARHGHVVDLEHRRILCTCRPCSLTFAPEGAGGSRFAGVPEDFRALGPVMTPEQWDRLQVPVGLAFLFVNSRMERTVMMYPGPGGATESEIDDVDWDALLDGSDVLAGLRPDVQALIVRRGDVFGEPAADDDDINGWIVPIDRCYELIGRLKLSWKGFSGGQEAREAITDFFADVERQCTEVDA